MSNLALPLAFTQRMQQQLGAEYDAFAATLQGEPITSIRLNPFKPTAIFNNEEQVKWAEAGRYLLQRPAFIFEPLFHAGTYYVQEASSMFIEQACNKIPTSDKPLKVLDMCAAPGGKSTHLLSLINNNGLLVSNEVIPNRNKILQQNISKWGVANAVVTQNKPEDFSRLDNYFDVVLVDAPCSGEGLFRKDKEAVTEWSEKNVEMCSIRQQDILQHAITTLKPGGYLIYSTCTYAQLENDNNIAWMQQQNMQVIPLKDVAGNSGIQPTQYGLQFYPHKVKGEGFYICLLQKPQTGYTLFVPKSKPPKQDGFSEIAKRFFKNPVDFILSEKKEQVYAFPAAWADDMFYLMQQLYVRQAGIPMGEVKGKDFIPTQELALSVDLNPNLPTVQLDKEKALTFLKSETFKPDTDLRGWCLAQYEGFNLGWMKVMDGRINNYYPKDWRILKDLPREL